MNPTRLNALKRLAASAILPTAAFSTVPVAGAQSLAPLRFLGLAIDDSKSVYYGVQAGVFRKYGLDVQPQLIGSGPAAIAALVGGSADVVLSNIVSVLQAHEKGIPLRLIVGGAWYLSDKANTLLLTAKDGPIRNAASLSGKTVGTVSLGGIFLVAIRAWIDQNGGDSRAVNIVEFPSASMVSLIDQGRLAAAASNEPAASQALATGRVRVLGKPMDAIGKRYEAAGFVVMEPAVQQDPDKFARFAKAMHEAQTYTNTHDAQTVDLVASYTGTTPEVVAHSIRATDSEYVDERNIQPVIDQLVKYGELKNRFSAIDIISSAAIKRPR